MKANETSILHTSPTPPNNIGESIKVRTPSARSSAERSRTRIPPDKVIEFHSSLSRYLVCFQF